MSESSTRCLSSASSPHLLSPRRKALSPETELKPIEPGDELPGGLVALYEARGRGETPLWLPEQRALVFADALTERDGELRVWATPWHQERVLPARCVRCSSSRS